MTDQSTFETALERRLLARVSRADQAFDAATVARAAIEATPRQAPLLRPSLRIRPVVGWALIVGLLAVVAAVAVGGVLAPRPDPLVLAVGRSDGFRIQPLGGPDGQRIGDGPYFQPRWSPDGAYVAVTALTDIDANHLLVYRADGMLVTEMTRVASELEWSPTRYDLAVQEIATKALNIISVEAGAIREVLQPAEGDRAMTFAWAPDGTQLVVAAVPADDGELGPAWVVDVDGIDSATRFGTDDASGLYGPRWSPDGERIAAVERCQGVDCIRIRDAASGQRRSEVMSLESPSRLGWSPDGSWIAFDSGGDLVIASSDVETVRPLTSGPSVDRFVEWAPDGRSVVIWRAAAEGAQAPYEFWAIPIDGSDPMLLVRDAFGVSIQPPIAD